MIVFSTTSRWPLDLMRRIPHVLVSKWPNQRDPANSSGVPRQPLTRLPRHPSAAADLESR
jgi:hypothetical protein